MPARRAATSSMERNAGSVMGGSCVARGPGVGGRRSGGLFEDDRSECVVESRDEIVHAVARRRKGEDIRGAVVRQVALTDALLLVLGGGVDDNRSAAQA